ncbi:MAG: ABC transporter permease [Kiloniellales bacterium]
MSSRTVMKLMVGFYIALFFLFLFGPVVMMGTTAFNRSSIPQVTPWQGFTLQWFGRLAQDSQMIDGITNSLWIGLGVVCLSVPISLAAAIMMTQIYQRVQPIYYVIVVSPVLTPGVILGISTLVFWDRLGTLANAPYESLYYDGMWLTIVGQSTFISAYCMLIFLARLQRFDRTQEEAALDLGANHVQVFWKILIPFLRPAVFAAAVLAFLTSFENYNTTVFTIQSESTLTTVLAGKVRMGTQPDLSALAVIIVVITLVGASLHEVLRRREAAREEAAREQARRAEMEVDMKLAAQPMGAE